MARCLVSLRAQTFTDFEVLLVDDGSTDGSAAIARDFVAQDPRFRLLSKPNGGLSSARNFGMAHAAGAYYAYLDSDDTIEPTMLATLHALAEEHHADMAVCGINDIYGEKVVSQFCRQGAPPESFVCSGSEALRLTLEGKRIAGSICCKLLRATALGEARFPEGLTYEDAHFIAQVTANLTTVAVSTESLYNYFHRENSITTERFNPRSLDVITVYEFVEKVVADCYPKLHEQARFRVLWAYFTVLDRMLATQDYRQLEDFPRVLAYLRAHTAEVVANPYFEATRRTAARALALSVGVYRLLLKAQQRRVWGGA